MDEKVLDTGLILRLAILIFIFSATSLIATAYNSQSLKDFLTVYQFLFIFSIFYVAVAKPLLGMEIRFPSFSEYSFALLLSLAGISLAALLFALLPRPTAIWAVPMVTLPPELPSEEYWVAYRIMEYSIALGVSPAVMASLLLNFIVAWCETTTFQCALPDFFITFIPEQIPEVARWLIAITAPNVAFGLYHYFSYGEQVVATIPAIIAGIVLTTIYLYCQYKGIPAQSAAGDAHYLFNFVVILSTVL